MRCLARYSINSSKYMHLIVDDLNLPLINWDVLTGPNHEVHTTVLEFLRNNGYSQLVHFPTRGSNLLDLVLTNWLQKLLLIRQWVSVLSCHCFW